MNTNFTYVTIRPGVARQVRNQDLLEFYRWLDRDTTLPAIVVEKKVPPKPPSKKVKQPHHRHFNGVGASIEYWNHGRKNVDAKPKAPKD